MSFSLSETPQLAKEAMHRVLTKEEKKAISKPAELAFEAGNIEYDDFLEYALKHVPMAAEKALYKAKIIGFEGLRLTGVNLSEAAVVYGENWHENL